LTAYVEITPHDLVKGRPTTISSPFVESDPVWGEIEDVGGVPPALLQRLVHYFSTYTLFPCAAVRVEVGAPIWPRADEAARAPRSARGAQRLRRARRNGSRRHRVGRRGREPRRDAEVASIAPPRPRGIRTRLDSGSWCPTDDRGGGEKGMDLIRTRTKAMYARRSSRQGGFSLLEVLIAVSVFGVAMAAATGYQIASLALSRSNQDLSAATDAAQSVLETLRAEEDFALIFSRYNAVGVPGNAFDVRGLEPALDDPDGRVGEIVFPGDGVSLDETVTDRLLGMPRNLNLDDDQDDLDVAADYRILTVMVRVRWRGASGNMQVQMVGTLAER
jgi:prepilin-type N-terminal cleavage/methylation domain-containing protein